MWHEEARRIVIETLKSQLAEAERQRDELLAFGHRLCDLLRDLAVVGYVPDMSQAEQLRDEMAAIARARSGEGQAGEGQED